jgi:hypothetical protein
MHSGSGGLYGNGKKYGDVAGTCKQGDRLGGLLETFYDGSVRFFKNGAQHGPGYTAGSFAGPVAAAVQMNHHNASVRLLPNVQQPE